MLLSILVGMGTKPRLEALMEPQLRWPATHGLTIQLELTVRFHRCP